MSLPPCWHRSLRAKARMLRDDRWADPASGAPEHLLTNFRRPHRQGASRRCLRPPGHAALLAGRLDPHPHERALSGDCAVITLIRAHAISESPSSRVQVRGGLAGDAHSVAVAVKFGSARSHLARLPLTRLRFNSCLRAVPARRQRARASGILWQLDDDDLARLDICEGFPLVYGRKSCWSCSPMGGSGGPSFTFTMSKTACCPMPLICASFKTPIANTGFRKET